MSNKKISQLPSLTTSPSDSAIFPLSDSGVTYSYTLSGLTTLINNDVLLTPLTDFTDGINQPITSSDTILSAFENTQTQIDNKMDTVDVSGNNGKVLYTDGSTVFWNTRMAVRDSGDTMDISYIEIDSVGNINIITTGETNTTISITNNEDSVTISDSGISLQNVISGNTSSLSIEDGILISYSGNGFNSNEDGVYITNPEKIYFPTSNNLSGETVALLSDLVGLSGLTSVELTYNIDLTTDYTISGCGIYEYFDSQSGNVIFPDPSEFNGGSITIINSTPSLMFIDNTNTFSPYYLGTGSQVVSFPANSISIIKSINSKWRAITNE